MIGPCIEGLEMESLQKKVKYQNIVNKPKYEQFFSPTDGAKISWTGRFKYVEAGRDPWDRPIIKKKRIFKKVTKEVRFLS